MAEYERMWLPSFPFSELIYIRIVCWLNVVIYIPLQFYVLATCVVVVYARDFLWFLPITLNSGGKTGSVSTKG